MDDFHKGVVVSRDGDRRAERFVTPCTSGISGALWPTNRRRSIATDWLAQQRRFFIMKGISRSCIQKYAIQYLRFFYPLMIAILVIAVIALVLLLFQYWALLFLFATIWSILVVFTTRFLYDKLYHIALVKYKSRSSRSLSALPQFPETPMPATPLIRVLETIDLSKMDVEQFIANEANQSASTQIHDVQEKQSADMSP